MDYSILELIGIYGICIVLLVVHYIYTKRKIEGEERKRKGIKYLHVIASLVAFNFAYSWYFGFNKLENIGKIEGILDLVVFLVVIFFTLKISSLYGEEIKEKNAVRGQRCYPTYYSGSWLNKEETVGIMMRKTIYDTRISVDLAGVSRKDDFDKPVEKRVSFTTLSSSMYPERLQGFYRNRLIKVTRRNIKKLYPFFKENGIEEKAVILSDDDIVSMGKKLDLSETE